MNIKEVAVRGGKGKGGERSEGGSTLRGGRGPTVRGAARSKCELLLPTPY